MSFSNRLFSIFLGTLLGVTLTACAPESSNPQNTTTVKLSAADIGRRIEQLASDKFEGREPGTIGGQMASQYVADEMKAAGLAPMGKDGSYFQPITLTRTTVIDGSFAEISKNGQDGHRYEFQKDIVYWTKRYVKSVSVKDSDLVFVGYGIIAPEYEWDDYAGIDVKGKTVVMLVNDPGFATKDETLFNGNSMTYYGRWTYKYEEAARQGAAAKPVVR
ncbi:MAG: hypothetical protein JKX72_11670 [Robiginitomaculum sp.]|nr:hypothetical protein [Robiginitomaculum sp.]